jgi:hypothetical protein
MLMPPYKRSHASIGQSSHGSHNNFGGNESKGAFASRKKERNPLQEGM